MGDGDAIPSLRMGVIDLYCLEAYYFGADKASRLAAAAAPLISAARSLAPSSAGARAEVALLLGRALDVAPAYSPAAEEALSRAVRLDPSSAEAWSALGHCAWKKGDLASAAAHYGASVKKRPTPEALRCLSQLARALLPGGAPLEAVRAAHAESIAHAKAALALALDDGPSWAVLGVAHLKTATAVSHEEEDYRRAAQAFARAAGLEAEGARDPTLHLNRAAAQAFLEDYEGALASYALAGQLDHSLHGTVRGISGCPHPCIPFALLPIALPHASAPFAHATRSQAQTHIANIRSRLGNLQQALSGGSGSGGGGAAAAAAAAAAPLSSAEAAAVGSRAVVAAASLAPGANPGVYLRLRFLRLVQKDGVPPSCFVAADEGAEGAPPVVVTSLHVAEEILPGLTAEERVLVVDPVCVRCGGGAAGAYEAVHAPKLDGLLFKGKFVSRKALEARPAVASSAFGGGGS